MISALVIASRFIQLGIDSNKPVTPLKLQKILYLAHGIHLAEYGKPLINESIQAWEYGPVIPVVYHAYKGWGNTPITQPSEIGIFIGGRFATGIDMLNEETESTVKIAWEVSKDMSGIQLSSWSHAPGSPWSKNYNGKVNQSISDESITEYFRKTMKKSDV